MASPKEETEVWTVENLTEGILENTNIGGIKEKKWLQKWQK